MRRRFAGAVMCATVMAASAAIAPSSTIRASGACDNAGPYTDTLCAGRHLYANEYLISPNGRYRFYYQADGHTLIYDTSDWEHWDASVPLFDVHGGANHLMYGVDASGQPSVEVNLWSFDRSNASALPYYISWGEAPGPGHYLRLENDGCLRAYGADGNYLWTMWC